MNDPFKFFCVVLITFNLGLVIGYVGGRDTIANDCQSIGAFRHGDKVFKCEEVRK